MTWTRACGDVSVVQARSYWQIRIAREFRRVRNFGLGFRRPSFGNSLRPRWHFAALVAPTPTEQNRIHLLAVN